MTGDWVKCDYNRTDHWQPSNWAPGADDVVKLTDDNFSDENLIKSDIWKENMKWPVWPLTTISGEFGPAAAFLLWDAPTRHS